VKADRIVGVIFNWREAYVLARGYSTAERRRLRVYGYRTGLRSKPWGYAIEEAK
jgi:hypothetical protein